jgi:hypothetical protein
MHDAASAGRALRPTLIRVHAGAERKSWLPMSVRVPPLYDSFFDC